MAITIPIISEFNGKGIQKAIKQFKQLETNGQKAMFVLKNGAKAAAAGFLAIGAAAAAAAAVGFDLVKAAAEDEKSQRMLALALKNSTHAKAEDIKASEKFIDVTSRQFGIMDDKLRPAYARLIRSTKDAEKAQRLLNLAINISAATGKPLETVAAALGRAYDGNVTALGRLGVGLDKATLKTKSFNDVQAILENKFQGAGAAAADTYEGKMNRLKVTFQELKESLGKPLLDLFKKVADAILRVSDAFGAKGLQGAIHQAKIEMSGLFYDENGKLNQFGQNINKVIAFYNNTVGGGGKLLAGLGNLVIGDPSKTYGELKDFATGNFGYSGLASYASPQDRGMNIIGAGRYGAQQGITVNIQMGVGDPVAVGRNVANVLRQYDRRSGGR